jgi:polyphenol oxidase
MDDLDLIRWETPRPYRVVFSTRRGGVSEGPFASLNLGRKSGDAVERADENRRIACEAMGADVEKLALNFQVHSDRVLRAAAGMRNEHADGLWTDEPGLPILAMSADCLPIALARADTTEPAIAVLHAGWKGLLAGIVEGGARVLGDHELTAAIGPGIGPCCYEVGEEVAAPYRERFGEDVMREGHLDLWTSAERALLAAGVEHIHRVDRCTACEPETFFSHRRDHGRTGRQGVIAYVAE